MFKLVMNKRDFPELVDNKVQLLSYNSEFLLLL
jgi:hypothetical protein